MTRCSRCGEEKEASGFGKHASSPSGIRSICRTCNCASAKAYHYANRDKVLAKMRERAKNNPEKRLAHEKKWAKAHPETLKAKLLRYRLLHPDGQAIRQARYHKAHPEVARASVERRRARKMKADGTYTGKDVLALYAAQLGLCYYCATPLDSSYHVDHKTPLSRGGSNWPDNLCCACAKCNKRKHTLTEAEFLLKVA